MLDLPTSSHDETARIVGWQGGGSAGLPSTEFSWGADSMLRLTDLLAKFAFRAFDKVFVIAFDGRGRRERKLRQHFARYRLGAFEHSRVFMIGHQIRRFASRPEPPPPTAYRVNATLQLARCGQSLTHEIRRATTTGRLMQCGVAHPPFPGVDHLFTGVDQ